MEVRRTPARCCDSVLAGAGLVTSVCVLAAVLYWLAVCGRLPRWITVSTVRCVCGIVCWQAHSDTTRFALTCNTSSKIIEALQSAVFDLAIVVYCAFITMS